METPERIGFFEETPGVKSSMRLMSFVSLFAAIACAFLTIYTSNPDGLVLTAFFLVSAFAPKTVQKFAEHQNFSRIVRTPKNS